MPSEQIAFPEGSCRGQEELLGHGPGLANALQRLAEHEKAAVENSILQLYERWMAKCPNAEHICYVDITFFYDSGRPHDGATVPADASTLVLLPHEDNNYFDVLENEYIGQEYTMTLHAAFKAGLPFVAPSGSGSSEQAYVPQTRGELREFYYKDGRRQEIASSYLLARIGAGDPETLDGTELPRAEGLSFLASKGPTYPEVKSLGNFEHAVSDTPFDVQWRKWLEVWREQAAQGKFRSHSGHGLDWILALPVVVRDAGVPEDVTHIASLFAGFDAKLDEEHVLESARYLLLHLYEANATSLVARRAEALGRESAMLAAAHETGKVIEAIMPGMSSDVADLLRKYFKDTISIPEKVTPNTEKWVEFMVKSAVSDELRYAAEIEAVEALAKESTHLEYAEIEQRAEEYIKIAHGIDGLPDVIHKRKPKDIEYFRRALRSAFRNCLKHSKERKDRSIDISYMLYGDGAISIKNSAIIFPKSSTLRAEGYGTLSTIKEYVKRYGGSLSQVEIKLLKQERVASGVGFRETWETIVPFIPEFVQ